MTDGPTTPPPSGPPSASAPLVERAKNILLTPKTEWPRIDAEPATIGGIYTSYVMILAAIGPIAMVIGQQLIGVSVLGVTFKPSLASSLGTAVLTYVMSLVGIYVLAWIIDALAPSFDGTKDQLKAFKVAAYSWTAAWLAAVFQIIPALWILMLVGLYSLYLLYLGLPVLMKVPEDKAVGYTVVVIIAAIVLWIIIGFIVNTIIGGIFGLGGMTGGPVVRY